jgi:MoxR-like ATPase
MAETAKAHAYLEGRDYVIPEDVKATAAPVGAHRLILGFDNENLDKGELLNAILATIPVPLA